MSDILKDENSNDQDKIQRNISIFNKPGSLFSNSHHTFIVRKSERLASALYVITGFIPTEEPVRTRLRVCALEIITRSSSPHDLGEGGVELFESRCGEIVTILQTASYAGLISAMNANLIGEEYTGLASFVRMHSQKISERRHDLQKSSISDPKTVSSPIRHIDKSLLKANLSKRTSTNNTKSDAHSRKEVIFTILSKKAEISIKDVMSFIPGVSGKTVQRELLSLVSKGLLTKKGSRRWTTYARAIQ